jgi:hypothetical protein
MDVKVNVYKIIELAIENGIESGWNKAHKYSDNPENEEIKGRIRDEIINELCEWINFDIGLE